MLSPLYAGSRQILTNFVKIGYFQWFQAYFRGGLKELLFLQEHDVHFNPRIQKKFQKQETKFSD